MHSFFVHTIHLLKAKSAPPSHRLPLPHLSAPPRFHIVRLPYLALLPTPPTTGCRRRPRGRCRSIVTHRSIGKIGEAGA